MRAVFIGASSLAVMTARLLLKRGHEVIFVEHQKERIDALTEKLDCGFLHGDGSKPAILRQVAPVETDILYCLTDNDQANILASLMGRSLGFSQVVTKIEDPELEHLCIELGLEDTIIPDRTIGRYLADMLEGCAPLELSTMLRDGVRVFSFVVREQDEGPVEALNLPENSRVICIYRHHEFIVPESETRLEAKDEVMIITHRQNLAKLEERWMP